MNALLQPNLQTDNYASARPAPRVGKSAEAASYLERNRGTLSLFGDQQSERAPAATTKTRAVAEGAGILRHIVLGVPPTAEKEPPPAVRPPRIVGVEGVEILRRVVSSQMGAIMDNDGNADYHTPRHGPRLWGAQASENAARSNAGTMDLVMDGDANRDYLSARPRLRVRDREAEDIAARSRGETQVVLDQDANMDYFSAKGPRGKPGDSNEAYQLRNGVVGQLLNHVMVEAESSSLRPQPRYPSTAAEENAAKWNGSGMQKVFDTEANQGYSSARPPSRTLTSAARENAARSHNGMMNTTDEVPKRDSRGVKPEAREIARANQHGTCGLALEGKLNASPRADPRVKGDARGNYEKGTHGTLGRIMSTYGAEPTPRPARSLQSTDAVEPRGTNSAVQQLFYGYGQLPRSARQQPRVKPEAREYAIRNQGTMSEFMCDN